MTINEQDKVFLREAIQMAEASVRLGGGPFAALVVRDGEIVGRGNNRVTLNRDPTAHAEVQAIRAACEHVGDFRLSGCTLYVSCEPCPMCLAASYWARLERVVYAASAADAAAVGFDDTHIHQQLLMPEAQRQLKMAQGLRAEGATPFRLWQQTDDRVVY